MKRPSKKTIFGALLAACALYFVLRAVPFRDRCSDATSPPSCEKGLISIVAAADPIMLALSASTYLVGSLFWSLRWRRLLRLAHIPVTVRKAWRVTIEAQAGGILLPGGVGGDALRVAAMVGRGAAPSVVVASVLLDRFIGLATMGGVAALLGWLAGGGSPLLLIGLAALPTGLLATLAIVRVPLIAQWLREGGPSRFTRAPIDYVTEPAAARTMAASAALSVGVSLTQIFVVQALIAALHITPTNVGWSVSGAALSLIVTTLPGMPGGWGTGDAAYVFFLGFAGVPPQAALATSLLYRAFWYLSGITGAGLRLLELRPRRPSP